MWGAQFYLEGNVSLFALSGLEHQCQGLTCRAWPRLGGQGRGRGGQGGTASPLVISLKLYVRVPLSPQMNSNQVLTYEIKYLWLLS